MNDLVKMHNNEPRAGTYLIAKGLDLNHQKVKQLVEKYKINFENFCTLKVKKLRSTGGRAADEYLLTEAQTMFLGTLLRNSDKVILFKEKIISEFDKCREQLIAIQKVKTEPNYNITRDASKLIRRETTDVMKEFVEYAKEQGSSSPDRYYTIITKMMNGMLFIVEGKFRNLRNVMTPQQLMTVSSAEHIIDKALRDGMKNKMYYKDIYKLVKERVISFADLHGQSELMTQQYLS